MDNARPILLVGNGPNRLEDHADNPSWDSLMRILARETGHKAFQPGRKPLPLAFEEVWGRATRLDKGSEGDLKRHVAKVARNVTPNWLHEGLRNLPVSNILTTNYDYSLLGRGPDDTVTPGSTETLYSLFRTQKRGATTIWHMHGEAAAPNTMLLGHHHYVRYSGRIQEYLRSREGGVRGPNEWTVSSAAAPISSGIVDFENLEPSTLGYPRYSWIDLLLTRETHIVGLGMDFSEIIIWWLLAARARREEKRSHGSKIAIQPTGPVTWWECGPNHGEPSYTDRREVAEALGVTTRFFPVVGNDYATAYRELLANLESCIST